MFSREAVLAIDSDPNSGAVGAAPQNAVLEATGRPTGLRFNRILRRLLVSVTNYPHSHLIVTINRHLSPKLTRSQPKVNPKLSQSWPKVGPKSAQSRPKVGSELAQSQKSKFVQLSGKKSGWHRWIRLDELA